MSAQRGLGRGFESLIPTDVSAVKEVAQFTSDAVAQIETSKIAPNPHQPRVHFDAAKLAELADSIKVHGILQPLVVSKKGDGYELIAGERRLRAAKLAGQAKVPVIIRSFDEQQKLELALIENLQRADLNPIEKALAYRKLVDEFNLTHDQLAKQAGQSKPVISNTMRLLNLPVEVQQMIAQGQISEGHSRGIMMIKDPAKQLEAARLIIQNGWTARQTESFARSLNQDGSTKAAAKKSSSDNQYTRDLSKYLKTKVRVQPSAKGGRLVIDYTSDDDLDRIFRTIKK